ncbi:MAG: acyltransferase [Ferruginibacter sp.]|nr:acyltransferase [Ferruginibacter sp.]
MHFGINDILYIPLFMALVLAIAANQQTIHKIFRAKPLQYLGDISYSIYLIHGNLIFLLAVPVLQKMGFVYKGPGSLQIPFWTGLVVCSIFLVSVVAVSSVTYFLIEKPCRKWINKSFAKKEKVPVVIAL